MIFLPHYHLGKDCKKTGENRTGQNEEELQHGRKNVTKIELVVSHDQTGTRMSSHITWSPLGLLRGEFLFRRTLIASQTDSFR